MYVFPYKCQPAKPVCFAPLMQTATVIGEVLGTPNAEMRKNLTGDQPKLFTAVADGGRQVRSDGIAGLKSNRGHARPPVSQSL
jgi:hypothetical protein